MKNPMRHVTLLVVVLAVTPLSNIRAQAVTVGDRVRVTAPTLDIDKRVGTLQALADDTLTINSLRVPLIWVTRLDIYRGTKGNAVAGALTGAVILGAAGAAVAVAWCDAARCNGNTYILPAAAVGTLVGALLGAGIGSLIRSDRWEEVPLDHLRVSFVPQRDGRFAFGLSVAF